MIKKIVFIIIYFNAHRKIEISERVKYSFSESWCEKIVRFLKIFARTGVILGYKI